MNRDKYISDVLKNIDADKKTLNRIKEDLLERIEMAEENDPFFDVVSEIGHPIDVAKEFNENLDLPRGIYVQTGFSSFVKPKEYISKKKIFGLPLVHINIGGRYQNKVAKGIIAIGDIAIGVVSLGGIAAGGVAVGGLSAGLLSLGGLALGGAALGGIAVGGVALGGIAIGGIAIGGIAIGVAKAIGDLRYIIL